jgi:hypothetical protein
MTLCRFETRRAALREILRPLIESTLTIRARRYDRRRVSGLQGAVASGRSPSQRKAMRFSAADYCANLKISFGPKRWRVMTQKTARSSCSTQILAGAALAAGRVQASHVRRACSFSAGQWRPQIRYLRLLRPMLIVGAVVVAPALSFTSCGEPIHPIARLLRGCPIGFAQLAEGDAPEIAACVNAAYRHYVERIGKPPGPMTEDYAKVIRERRSPLRGAGARSPGFLFLRLPTKDFCSRT